MAHIDGVAYNMSPAPSRKHQEINAKIFNSFYAFLKGNPCKAYIAPFDQLRINFDNDHAIEVKQSVHVPEVRSEREESRRQTFSELT